jgi:hypothetical protein
VVVLVFSTAAAGFWRKMQNLTQGREAAMIYFEV